MTDFYQRNYEQLRQNFEKEVLEPYGKEPHLQTAEDIDLAFGSYAEEEELRNKFRYNDLPDVDISAIQEKNDQELMERNLQVPDEYGQPQDPIPEARPELEWDYRPTFDETDEMKTQRIIQDTAKNRRDNAYIAKRIQFPGLAKHFDSITRINPRIKQNSLGRLYTEEDEILHDYILSLWPSPDIYDAIRPAQKLPGLINKLKY